ncbi:MAG: TlpA family protein disulfide reductase [Nitrospirae bacterium]|nr:TlpA family protein disulfide reductase [Nitrospirota bacterium]
MIQMKRLISASVLVFFAGLIVLVASCAEKKSDLADGNLSPKLDIRDARTGQAMDLSQLKGKVVFVNFWASWCMPCKEEMPSIEALYRELLKNDAFLMVTILYKDDAKTAADYMHAHNYTFPLFIDNEGISAKRYGVTGVPETYLIDKKGALKKRVIGPADWNSSEAKAFINTLLSE